MGTRTAVAVALTCCIMLGTTVGAARAAAVKYDNPVAGMSIVIPDDWEMATSDWGTLVIGLDPRTELPALQMEPQLWFFYGEEEPEAMARGVARDMPLVGAQDVQLSQMDASAWQVDLVVTASDVPIRQRWLCRKQGEQTFALVAFVRADQWQRCEPEIDTALRSCILIAGPTVRRFLEPTENAYRMLMPEGYQWSGHILRTANVPGYFVWEVKSPDELVGASSAPPSLLDITHPYMPAAECARTIVLDYLRGQFPGIQLEAVRDYPRFSAYGMWRMQMGKTGEGGRLDKAQADYIIRRGGASVRLRATLVTLRLSALPTALSGFGGILGQVAGQGNWTMFASSEWAPVEQWEKLHSIGRGIVASVATDPDFSRNQRVAVSETALGRMAARDLAAHKFIIDYLQLRDRHEPGRSEPHTHGLPRHRHD